MVASAMAEKANSTSAEGVMTQAKLIYFSSASNYTQRFVEKLGFEDSLVARLPLITKHPTLLAQEPFVLLFPTYGGGDGNGAVPKQVIKFLNVPENRALLQGVIASGNTNFYDAYCLGGDIVARKTNKPVMYRFELMGTQEDVEKVRTGLEELWEK